MVYKECIKVWRQGVTEDSLNNFFIKNTYCNIKIENKKITLRDVETVFRGENIIEDWNVSKKIIKDIENHKNLCQNLLKLIKENNSKLSLALIKHFHNTFMKDCFTDKLIVNDEKTEEFKKGNYAGASSSSLEAVDNLESLIGKINNVQIDDNNALKVVSYFACSFEQIQHFDFGNGLVARMLINYLLIGNNIPPIVIFYSDKAEYYLALEHFNQTKEISPMVKFMEEQAYKTWLKNYNLKLKSLKEFVD